MDRAVIELSRGVCSLRICNFGVVSGHCWSGLSFLSEMSQRRGMCCVAPHEDG